MFSCALEDATVATGAQPSGSDETAAPQLRCVLWLSGARPLRCVCMGVWGF